MSAFRLVAPPLLSRGQVGREERLRLDTERLRAEWPKARVLLVDEKGRAPVAPAGDLDGGEFRVLTRPATEFGAEPPPGAALLGEHDGATYWGLRADPSLVTEWSTGVDGHRVESVGVESVGVESVGAAGTLERPVAEPVHWQDLRTRGADLDPTSAALLVAAVAVLRWHDDARFCGRCGSPTEPRHAGWTRVCARCGHEEYPRTDPAVICLVHDGGVGGSARVLLARQPVWPPGRYSVLAGFVEAGESLEACVAREIEEEVGVSVSDICYLGSQAWPFPRSLMIGFSAVADPARPLHLADGEIAEAFWLTRAELRAALRGGDWATGSGETLLLPPPVSIARSMLESWARTD